MEQMKTENIQVKTRMITLSCAIQWKSSEKNIPEQEYSILSKFQVPALQYYYQRYTKKRNLRNIHDMLCSRHQVRISGQSAPDQGSTHFFLVVERRMREKHDIKSQTIIHTFRVEELGPTRCCLRLTNRSCI